MDIFHHKYVPEANTLLEATSSDQTVAGLVLQGIGLDHDLTLCTAGVYVCVTLYGLAKIFVYLFLGEQWSSVLHNSRLSQIYHSGTSVCRLVPDASNSSVQVPSVLDMRYSSCPVHWRCLPSVYWFAAAYPSIREFLSL
jgi:hypothetical protein